jgi:adenosine deaminase
MRRKDLQTIEKVELHCHLDGVLDAAMLTELRSKGLNFGLSPEELRAVYPVTSKEDWLAGYCATVLSHLEPREERLLPILETYIDRLRKQNVVYAELMLNGLLSPEKDTDLVLDVFHRFRERADRAAGNEVQVEFLVAIARGPEQKVQRQVRRILSLFENGLICGVALAGDEGACTIRSLHKEMDRLRETGMGIEIHAGEWGGPDSVWDALEYGKPDRIGHGVRSFEDDSLVAAIRERDVHLEFCPTSNLKTGSVRSMAEHPIAQAAELGMNFSVNTDDPGPFECSMLSECELLQRTLGFNRPQFEVICENSLKSSFARRRIGGQHAE